jgi:gas vesicle protein
MEHEDTEYGTSTFMAFLFGLAAGAGLGLLLAPKSGQESREKIREFSRDAMDKTRGAMEKTRGTAHNMQERARSMMRRGKGAVEESTTASSEMLDPTYRSKTG